MNKLSLFVLLALISGCVPLEVDNVQDPSYLLDGSFINADDLSLRPEDVFALTDEMKAWVKSQTRSSSHARSRLRRIVQGLIDDGLLNLEYDENLTHTAADTFYSKKGNCLSFSILFVALAREADLDVTFQMVDIPPSFSSSGELVMLNNHINVLVRRIRSDTQFHQNHVVDFNTAEYSGNYETTPVSDEYALALYHSNIGVEKLRNQDYRNAFVHIRRAIMLDDANPGIWTNLGALYSKLEMYERSIDAFKQALSLRPTYKSALVNIPHALERVGRFDEAEIYRQRAKYYQRQNPYFHYQHAVTHFESGDYLEALDDIRTAIRIKKDEHQFYFLEGLIHLRLDEPAKARGSYELARSVAQRDDISARYGQKLKFLAPDS